MGVPPPTRTFILDACTTTTFGRVNRLDLVTSIPATRVVIGHIACAEVSKEPAKSVLAKALKAASLAVEAIDPSVSAEAAAWAHFDAMPAFRGRGEAEVLALAVSRGYAVVTDEVAVCSAARVALSHTESCFMTTHLLQMAVADGRLALSEAVTLFHSLDVAQGKLASLRRLGHSIEDLLRA